MMNCGHRVSQVLRSEKYKRVNVVLVGSKRPAPRLAKKLWRHDLKGWSKNARARALGVLSIATKVRSWELREQVAARRDWSNAWRPARRVGNTIKDVPRAAAAFRIWGLDGSAPRVPSALWSKLAPRRAGVVLSKGVEGWAGTQRFLSSL